MSKSSQSIQYVLKALLISFIITAVFLLVLALLLYKLKWGADAISIGTNITYVVSCFVPAMYIGKKLRSRRFLWGMLTGASYFVILLVISLAMGRAVFGNFPYFLTVAAMCVGSGAAGGMLS